jgi:hypothetical protein
MIPRKLKNFALFVDGYGYAGRCEEIALPKLTRKMEEFRAGGMDGPVEIDLGQEKLECEVTLAEYDESVIKQYGLQDGSAVKVKMKGSIERDDASGDKDPVEVVLQGRWRELDFGTWKGGENSTLKMAVAATYYKYSSKGEDLIEIDLVNMVCLVGGQDRLATTRANLGI